MTAADVTRRRCRNQTSYKCTFCDKKFKGLDYLQKHIRNKHGDELHDYKDQERHKVRPAPPPPTPDHA